MVNRSLRFARGKWLGHLLLLNVISLPSRKRRNRDFEISGRLSPKLTNSKAIYELSPSSRRIETRALDDFRVIEHVHSFSKREDFEDRAVCFDTNDDNAILHSLIRMNKRRSSEQLHKTKCIYIYIYTYFTENTRDDLRKMDEVGSYGYSSSHFRNTDSFDPIRSIFISGDEDTRVYRELACEFRNRGGTIENENGE